MHLRAKNYFMLFLGAILVLGLSGLVAAQPPGQTLGEMLILYPKYSEIEVNQDFKFHLHSFAATGDLLLPSIYDCTIHIYRPDGSHLIEDFMSDDSNGLEKSYTWNSSVTNTLGWHSYNIWCNSSNEAGAVSEPLEITPNGRVDVTNGIDWFTLMICFGFITMLSLAVSFMIRADELSDLKILFFFWGIIHIFLMGLTSFVLVTNTSHLYSFYPVILSYFSINIIILLYVIWSYGRYLIQRAMEGGLTFKTHRPLK